MPRKRAKVVLCERRHDAIERFLVRACSLQASVAWASTCATVRGGPATIHGLFKNPSFFTVRFKQFLPTVSTSNIDENLPILISQLPKFKPESSCARLLYDPPNLRLEAHVEHAICFVKH
eukprot:6177327-Pleurochrysis_carterae.AAC.1